MRIRREEVEITPKMLAAGARVICDQYGLATSRIAEWMAQGVFVAMTRAQQENEKENEEESK